MNETKLSIVIVNYNVKHLLEQCLISVRAAINGLSATIFVVDNHSTDESVACLRPLFPEVIFIENTHNPGFAKANNQAIRQCNSEYILLLNPDTVIGEDCLHKVCAFMDNQPDAGALGVKMLNAQGAFLPESKRSFPTPWVSCCKLFGLSKLFPQSARFAAYSLPYLHPDSLHHVEVLAGAFMLLRATALKKTGLLDESFFMYGEDIDLSCRMLQAGFHNYYFPERILHYKGESTKKGDRKYLNAFYDAMLIFYRKYYPQSGWFVSSLIRLSIVLRKGYAALFERKFKESKAAKKQRRVLVLCRKAHFEKVQTAMAEQIQGLETVEQWDIDEMETIDTLNQCIQSKTISDIVFCYPDIAFSMILLWMDQLTDKTIICHISHLNNGLFISPNY